MDDPASHPPSADVGRPPRRSIPSAAWFAIAAVSVLAMGALVLLLVRANQEKSDLEADLGTSRAEVARLTEDVESGAQRERDLEAELSGTTDQLTEKEAELATVNEELAIAGEELEDAEEVRAAVIELFAVSMSVGAGVADDEASCLAEAIEDDMGAAELLRATAASADFAGDFDSDLFSFGLAVLEAADGCGIDTSVFGGASLPLGDNYGDNPVLDELWDSCAAGELGACDDLYNRSPVGSEYERYAVTCGDRFTLEDAPFRCAEG